MTLLPLLSIPALSVLCDSGGSSVPLARLEGRHCAVCFTKLATQLVELEINKCAEKMVLLEVVTGTLHDTPQLLGTLS